MIIDNCDLERRVKEGTKIYGLSELKIYTGIVKRIEAPELEFYVQLKPSIAYYVNVQKLETPKNEQEFALVESGATVTRNFRTYKSIVTKLAKSTYGRVPDTLNNYLARAKSLK